MSSSSRLVATLPVVLAALLLLPGIGATDFTNSDEPRYAVAAREMIESGDLLRLTVNGEPYRKKPPLLMWAQAGLASVTRGIDEATARLPSALAGIGLVLLTGLLGTALFGARTGWWSALLLAISTKFVLEARMARMDVILAFFVAASFLGFVRWERRLGRPMPAVLLCLLPLPLGVLTKWTGPLFFLLPAISYLLLTHQFRRVRPGAIIAAVLLSLAPFLLVSDLGEFGRVLSGSAHSQSIWFHLVRLPLVTLPAFLLIPVAIVLFRRWALPTGERRALLLLAAWVGVGVLMLSLSRGKRSNYLDPLMPAVALIGGWTVVRLLSAGMTRRFRIALAAGAALVVAVDLFWVHVEIPRKSPAKSVRRLMEAFRERAGPDAPLYWLPKRSASVKKPGPEFVFYGERRIGRLKGLEAARTALAQTGTGWILMPTEVYEPMRNDPDAPRLEIENLSPKRRYVILSLRSDGPPPLRISGE